MATTMREVAEAAGVSIATVSFVVNNSKRVAPETRERIERVMAEWVSAETSSREPWPAGVPRSSPSSIRCSRIGWLAR